jgi:ATP-dependent Clp protease adaptor protein ClpS
MIHHRVYHYASHQNLKEFSKFLMKVIPGMTVDITMNVMQEAPVNGPPVVIICPQSDAEEHCLQLQRISLRSSIEPTTGGC